MTPGFPLLSIIVPCFNEEENLPALLRSFAEALRQRDDVELILVDNGSTDETLRVLEREISVRRYGFARIVAVQKNFGYGAGILSGLREARGEVLAWTHADLQTDTGDVLRAFDFYRRESSTGERIFVKGHRTNRRFMEKLFSAGMQIVASAAHGVWLSEINAQPKLFPKAFYREMTRAPEDFSLDLYALLLAKKRGYAIRSIPVRFHERMHGKAKGGSGKGSRRFTLIVRTLRYLFSVKL